MTSIINIVFHYIIASVNSSTHNLLPCSQAVGSGQVKPRIYRTTASVQKRFAHANIPYHYNVVVMMSYFSRSMSSFIKLC